MGLARNLRKTLNDWVDKILVELSCHYIKHLAKQTTKRPDNSSQIMSSPNRLTRECPDTTIVTSSADTSEKIIMKMETEDLVAHIREWSIDTIESKRTRVEDQLAIMEEFYEWINPDTDDLEIVSLEEITEEEYQDYLERG